MPTDKLPLDLIARTCLALADTVDLSEELTRAEDRIRQALKVLEDLPPLNEGEWKDNAIGVYLRQLSAIRQAENILKETP